MGNGGDQKLTIFRRVAVVLGVVCQPEGGAGGGSTDCALAVVLLQTGIDGLTLVAQHACAVRAVWPGVLAGVMPRRCARQLAVGDGTDSALRTARQAAVVPTAGVAVGRVDLTQAMPLVDAVVSERRPGLGIADASLLVGNEGAIMVGNDQGVPTMSLTAFRVMFEPAEEPFFGEQTLEKGKVTFLVLHGHAAFGINRRIGQTPFPGGNEPALTLPVAEQLIDDVDDAFVLKQVVVAIVTKESQPGFDDQPVAPKTAIGPLSRDVCDVAVERTPHSTRGCSL